VRAPAADLPYVPGQGVTVKLPGHVQPLTDRFPAQQGKVSEFTPHIIEVNLDKAITCGIFTREPCNLQAYHPYYYEEGRWAEAEEPLVQVMWMRSGGVMATDSLTSMKDLPSDNVGT